MANDWLPFEKEIAEAQARLERLEAAGGGDGGDGGAEELRQRRRELAQLKRRVYSSLEPWHTVLFSRHDNRPQLMDYVGLIFDEFVELHGDRAFGNDRA